MQDQLTDLILHKLDASKMQLKSDFTLQHPIKVARHFVLDDLLPAEIALNIFNSFPNPKQMHLLSSPGKIKAKYSYLKETSSIIHDTICAIQDPRVVAAIEEITEIKNQIPDTSLFAGGVSSLSKGYYFNPHLDVSHNVASKNQYRTLNLLYYVSPNWKLDNGGSLELWDESINKCITIESLFNRLVVMETNTSSWHAVNPILVDAPRCCVFNYFFSEQSPESKKYLIKNTTFRPRPEQKIRRAVAYLKHAILKMP